MERSKFRLGFAFVMSPTLGVWSTYGVLFLVAEPELFHNLPSFLWSIIEFGLSINVTAILLCVPVYLLIRNYFSWNLWACVFGGLIAAFYVSIVSWAGSFVTNLNFWIKWDHWEWPKTYWSHVFNEFGLVAVPAMASGFFFWLLIGKGWRTHSDQPSNNRLQSDAATPRD